LKLILANICINYYYISLIFPSVLIGSFQLIFAARGMAH